MGSAATSCNGNGCGRACGRNSGDSEGPSRVSNSRQNYDYPGDQVGTLSPTDPKRQFVEEPLDPELWDAKKEGLANAMAQAEREATEASLKEQDDADRNGENGNGDGYTTPRKDATADKTVSANDVILQDDIKTGLSPAAEIVPKSPAGASAGGASPDVQPDQPVHDKVPRMPAEEGGVESVAKKRWKSAVRKVIMAKNMGAKIVIENKIGSKLTGWFRDVALELQKGIAAEGRSQSQPRFEAPEGELFNRVRIACGFSPARYFATMGLQDGLKEPNLALIGGQDAAGKSGSFFFLSPDQQLIAKSCTSEDYRVMLRILTSYVDFVEAARVRANAKRDEQSSISQVVENGRSSQQPGSSACVRGFIETLLPRFLGLYKLTLPGDDPKNAVCVLVMANVFGGARTIERRYDLKGSTHGRKASKKECAKRAPTFKDIDWVAKEPGLVLGSSDRHNLIESVTRDLAFLAKHGLMDYSLLVGVHDLAQDAPSVYEPMNVITVRDKTRHCYLGIIDVLTPYKTKKRAETFCIGTLVCGRDISCQHPKVYARRFFEFTDTQVFDLDKEPSHRDERP